MGNHSILYTFKVLCGLMDLSITKYNNFIDSTSDSTLQLFKKNHYLSNFSVLSKKNIYNYLKKLFFFPFINICLGEAWFSSSTSTKTYYTRLPRDTDTRIQLPSILKIKHSYNCIVENIGIFHKNMWWVYHYFKMNFYCFSHFLYTFSF